jgi:hypothetical protein
LTKLEPIDTASIGKHAQVSDEKEAYVQLEKTQTYRIGVGARAHSPNISSFFIEVIIKLSSEIGKVDLRRLEKALMCLKALKARGYTLAYEDDDCISCELVTEARNPDKEYQAIKVLMQEIYL